MSDVQISKRRWLRFSLATFLFVSLCIGALISGYQSGYRAGDNSGRFTRYGEAQASETYSTVSIIWPDLPQDERAVAVNTLKDLIRSTIATDIWSDGTGNDVNDFPTNQTLIITAPGSVHREIRVLFDQLENLSARGGAEQLLPALQALASQGKSQTTVLPIAAPKNSQIAHAWLEKYFGLTVDGISKRWGAPRYEGECRDAGFPEWSLDQRIATWRRGNGLSYLALRYLDDGQRHIVAGWRDDS